jgi:hypothetical protein
MISKDEWWTIINQYNSNLYPIQLVFALIILIALIINIYNENEWKYRIIYFLLSLSFLWISVSFFLVFGKGVAGDTYGNYFFSIVFILLSFLFLRKVFIKGYVIQLSIYNKILILIIFFLYPLIGIFLKRPIMDLIFAGTMPCPTVAIACILVSFEKRKLNLIDILLLFWAIPMTPFLQVVKYGVYEDMIMFCSGIYLIVMRIIQKKKGLAI